MAAPAGIALGPADELKPPVRPDGGGTLGSPIDLRTNHFKIIQVGAARTYYQYDVAINRVRKARGEGSGAPGPSSAAGPSSGAGPSQPPSGEPGPSEEPPKQGEAMDVETPDPAAFDQTKSRRGHERTGAAAIPPPMNIRVMQELTKKVPELKMVAYDGRKIMYSAQELQQITGTTYEVEANDEDNQSDNFQVKFQLVTGLNSQSLQNWYQNQTEEFPQDLVAAIDIVMRQGRASQLNRYVPWAGAFYDMNKARVGDLGEGCDAWRGIYQSVLAKGHGLSMNMDSTHSAFYQAQPVIQYAKALLFRGGRMPETLDQHAKRTLQAALKHLKLKTDYAKEISYKVKSLGASPREASFFSNEEGRNVSVLEYFETKHGIKLKHPDLPCIVATKKDNHIPMEVCHIRKGTRRASLLSPNQTSAMIRVAAVKAPDRIGTAIEAANAAAFSADPICQEFGIEMNTTALQVRGRILKPPVIEYANEEAVHVSNGQWRAPQRGPGFMLPSAPLTSWGVIVGTDTHTLPDRDLHDFLGSLARSMDSMNIPSTEPMIIRRIRVAASTIGQDMARARDEISAIADRNRKPRIQLLLIIVRNQDVPIYNAIKKAGDCDLGFPTQVMLAKHATFGKKRGVNMYCSNLVLKINAKLGGKNFTPLPMTQPGSFMGFENNPFMVIGADVTHPAPGSRAFPSISAMVGSLDRWLASHVGVYRAQEGTVEVVEALAEMLEEMLKAFAARNKNVLPKVLVIYRDGVSDGQFAEVLNKEMAAIWDGCRKVQNTYKPQVIFIVCKKRHHTRFMTVDPRQSDKSQNMPAGTVIDTGVTHPKEFDFFLCSHAGIQGTSRPAHYHVLYNDWDKLTSDNIQCFTFRLAHAFARSNRSVSLPTQTYYAHLLAFRARCYVPPEAQPASHSTESNGDQRPLSELNNRMKGTMHFI